MSKEKTTIEQFYDLKNIANESVEKARSFAKENGIENQVDMEVDNSWQDSWEESNWDSSSC